MKEVRPTQLMCKILYDWPWQPMHHPLWWIERVDMSPVELQISWSTFEGSNFPSDKIFWMRSGELCLNPLPVSSFTGWDPPKYGTWPGPSCCRRTDSRNTRRSDAAMCSSCSSEYMARPSPGNVLFEISDPTSCDKLRIQLSNSRRVCHTDRKGDNDLG